MATEPMTVPSGEAAAMQGAETQPVAVALQRRRLTRRALERFLTELEQAQVQSMTRSLKPGWASGEEPLAPLPAPLATEMARLIERSPTGAVLFWSQGEQHLVLPPLPVQESGSWQGWNVSPLRRLLEHRYVLGVLLLRLGGYTLGVFDGEQLEAAKTGTRYVKGRHKAGGWSQQRFARIREKQVRELFDEVCQQVARRFAPYESRLDFLALGGDRHTLQAFLKRCPYLQRLAPKTLPRILPAQDPNRETLEGILTELWKSEVVTSRPR